MFVTLQTSAETKFLTRMQVTTVVSLGSPPPIGCDLSAMYVYPKLQKHKAAVQSLGIPSES